MTKAINLPGVFLLAACTIGVAGWSTRAQDPAATTPATNPTTNPTTDSAAAAPAGPEFQTTPTGLRYKITAPAAEPAVAQTGDWVSVHYTGKLENGQLVDTSIDFVPEGRFMVMKPLTFKLGEKRVIAGWEEGIVGMKVGEKRTLVIPPELAYGKTGAGRGLIPPDATLIFDIQLIGVYRPEPEAPATQPK